MTQINFRDIRTHKGSQHEGFEELCCQLASFEEVPIGSIFRRKSGAGGDGGVECYWQLPNENEKAWQTKYFLDGLGDTQWKQIDKSVKAALDKHPKLIEYIVCLPINRTEGRKDGQKSQMDHWDDHVENWHEWAKEREMTVKFVYWGESEILERLSRPQPQYAGRAYFWFNKQELTNEWMMQHFQEARANTGARYTPEIHVDLPIAQIFEGLGRTSIFFDLIDNLYSQLCRKWKGIKLSKELEEKLPDIINLLNNFEKDVNSLIAALKKASDREASLSIDFHSIASLAEKIWRYDYTQIRLINPSHTRQQEEEVENRSINRSIEESLRSIRSQISKVEEIAGEIHHFANSKITDVCNQGTLLIIGEAGKGKTHLFCDIAKHRLDKSLPTIILLGQHFCQGDPWIQIMQRLNLSCSRDEFLGALDAAAQAHGSHAMILIDALNESGDKGLWKNNLAGILTVLCNYPRIAIAVSCRTLYERVTIPDNLIPEKLIEVEHHGFANHEYIATKTFFNYYGIVRPNVPLLIPEYSNPLFLKILCQGIGNLNSTQIPKGIKGITPKGIRGITAVFNLFIDSINKVLCKRIDYDDKTNLVRQSVQALACQMAEKEQPWIEREEAKNIVNSFLPNKEFSQSLFSNLLAEGLLSEDLIYHPSEEKYEKDQEVHIIKFSYGKFSDHLIISYLLKKYLDKDNLTISFDEDKPLGRLVAAKWNAQGLSGLLEALSIQIPEIIDKELMEITSWTVWWFKPSFLQSLIWRNPIKITQKTKDYLNEIFQEEGEEERVYNILLTVATDPEHPLNAKFLHRHLINLRMPERDAIWSIYLFDQYEQKGAVDRLLEWAWEAEKDHISDESIELCTIALTWFLTTSHRFLRDRVTKALVSMLHSRPQVLVKVIEQFLEVDDLYVLERLYAVAYGVAMVSNNTKKTGELANKIYEWVFKEGKPPVHILLRDYARGVIEIASYLGTLSENVDIDKIRPPYKSDWNLDIPTEEELKICIELIKLEFDINLPLLLLLLLFKSWQSNHLIMKLIIVLIKSQNNRFNNGDNFKWSLDAIYISTTDYFMGGDFSQYVVEPRTRHWSSCILGKLKEPTKKQRCEQFIDSLTTIQKKAWEKYQTICGNVDLYKKLDTTDRRKHFGQEFTDKELEEAIISGKTSFLKSIGKKKIELFEKYVMPYLENPNIDEYKFDTSIAKRWMVKRVLELGWTIDKFGWFDRRCCEHGRAANKPERIGKKYQWIALHEFLAHMADNLEFREDSWLNETSQASVYEGTWQINIRDIDPSFLLKQISESQQKKHFWLKPIDYTFEEVDKQGRIDWIKKQNDCPNPCQLIELTNPNSATTWLTLEGHYDWTEENPLEEEKYENPRRQIWYQIRSYIVNHENIEIIYQWLKNKNLTGAWMPESGEISDIFIGELPWSSCCPKSNNMDNYWTSHTNNPEGDLPHPVVVTTAKYSFNSSFDCSTDEDIFTLIPSVWLLKNMELKWAGEYFNFVDSNNKVVAFNPLNELSPESFLVSKNELIDFLSKNNLDIIWTVLGERQLIGGNQNEQQRPLVLSGVYRLKDDEIKGNQISIP